MSRFLSDWVKQAPTYTMARALYYTARAEWPSFSLRRRRKSDSRTIASYLAGAASPRLQIGSGINGLDGWLNTDYFPQSDDLIHLDATAPFPFADNTFDLIFSEHVIEHVPLEGGVNMIEEAFRTLKPGGRLRISTPPFEFLLKAYTNPQVPLNKKYLDWHLETYNADSPARDPLVLVNDYIRMWGHVFIYDEALLKKLFQRAGFVDLQSFDINQSDDPRLTNLEHDGRMPDGLLKLSTMTIEGIKPV